MVWWAAMLIAAGFSILGQLLAPKVEGPKPDDKPNIPDIDETRPIPVLWGECLITNPQLFWWGDYKVAPIKKKVFTGLWFKKITTGFRYSLGCAFGLCAAGSPNNSLANYRGIEAITEIQFNEKVAWSGSAGQNQVINLNLPSFFGGDKDGGNGGIKARLRVHTGDYTPALFQTKDPYLQTQLTRTPTWKGLAYVVWEGPSAGFGYYGNSSSLEPIAFKAKRRPNLGLLPGPGEGNETFHEIPGTNDANPAHCLLELFLNEDWGVGDIETHDCDLDAWRAVAEVLANEGNGFSYYWDRRTSLEEMANIILRQIDGVVYTDLETGLITLKLARADYDPNTIPSLTNDHFIEIKSVTRGAWDETLNEVRVTYTDASKNFKSVSVFDQDLANVLIQEGTGLSSNINYPGVSYEQLARNLARRDLQALTVPLLRFTGTVDRTANTFAPGSVFKFTWAEQGIISVVMRVTKIRLGTLQDGRIELDCVEDRFSSATALFTTTGTAWVDPTPGDAVAVVNGGIAELPYWFAKDDLSRGYAFAEQPDADQQSYQYVQEDVVEDDFVDFTPSAVLTADLDQLTNVYGSTFTVSGVTGTIPSGTFASAEEGSMLIRVDDEWMCYEGVTNNGDGTFTLTNVWRGVLDTVPVKHLAGARVWFLNVAFGLIETDYPAGTTLNAEFLTQTPTNTLSSSSAPDYTLSLGRRALKPYPPAFVRINGSYSTTTIPDTGDIVIAAHTRSRLTEVVRRQDASTDTPELGTKYIIQIFGNTNNLIRTVEDTTPTYTYTNAQELADFGTLQTKLSFVLYSRRDGLNSLQAVIRSVIRTGGTLGTPPSYTPGSSDNYTPAPDGSVLSGVQVVGTPSGTNNTPVYNPTTGTITWQPSASASILTVEESDGSPSADEVETIKFKTPDFVVVDEGGGIVRIEKSADPGADFNLIITHDAEVCVDEATGEVVYFF